MAAKSRGFMVCAQLARPSAEPARQALLAALPGGLHPRVRSADPVLIEAAWRCDGENQVHLVNYLERPQIVQVSFGAPVVATVISPDRSSVLTLRGEVMQIEVDIYSVLKVVGE